MHEWTKAVVQDPWFAFSGWIIGAVSVILAVVFYRRSKRDKAPVYDVHTNVLIEGLQTKVPSLRISYTGHEEPIENLTVSRVSFWNAGRQTINKADVASKSPLVLWFSGTATILDAELLYQGDEANAFNIAKTPDRTEAYILFDHVDHHEGAIFQVVHTGTRKDTLRLRGKVKGSQVKYFGDVLKETGNRIALSTLVLSSLIFFASYWYSGVVTATLISLGVLSVILLTWAILMVNSPSVVFRALGRYDKAVEHGVLPYLTRHNRG